MRDSSFTASLISPQGWFLFSRVAYLFRQQTNSSKFLLALTFYFYSSILSHIAWFLTWKSPPFKEQGPKWILQLLTVTEKIPENMFSSVYTVTLGVLINLIQIQWDFRSSHMREMSLYSINNCSCNFKRISNKTKMIVRPWTR